MFTCTKAGLFEGGMRRGKAPEESRTGNQEFFRRQPEMKQTPELQGVAERREKGIIFDGKMFF